MREVTELESGRHADAVDQADAILWTEDLRMRALKLCHVQDELLARVIAQGPACISGNEAATWMAHAYEVLREVARG